MWQLTEFTEKPTDVDIIYTLPYTPVVLES